MIKVGQIYKTHINEIIVITQSDPRKYYLKSLNTTLGDFYSCINTKGEPGIIHKSELLRADLIIEYPTWQEAVNSKEFNQ